MKQYFILINGPMTGVEVLCKGIRSTDNPMYFLPMNELSSNEKNHALAFFNEEEMKKFHEFQTDGDFANQELKGFSYQYWNELLTMRIGCFMQSKCVEFK